ncbi:hypothetical protein COO60DRAFT_900862 [Scenedesmus sp. NREL 46B-D3]|nr:hypothetical protein COO60DRAFT_900862 [Scenedesmus sp. NREL 46B-D3]
MQWTLHAWPTLLQFSDCTAQASRLCGSPYAVRCYITITILCQAIQISSCRDMIMAASVHKLWTHTRVNTITPHLSFIRPIGSFIMREQSADIKKQLCACKQANNGNARMQRIHDMVYANASCGWGNSHQTLTDQHNHKPYWLTEYISQNYALLQFKGHITASTCLSHAHWL